MGPAGTRRRGKGAVTKETKEVAAIVGEREVSSMETRKTKKKREMMEMEEMTAPMALHLGPTLLPPVTVTLLPHLAMVLPLKLMELLLTGANKKSKVIYLYN